MQVSGDIIVLVSGCPRGSSHDPLTKLGGSLSAPIGQLDARTIKSPDSYLIARGVVSNQSTPASRFQLRAQSSFFDSEKLPKMQHTQKRRGPRGLASSGPRGSHGRRANLEVALRTRERQLHDLRWNGTRF
jgi:hypothetical protein